MVGVGSKDPRGVFAAIEVPDRAIFRPCQEAEVVTEELDLADDEAGMGSRELIDVLIRFTKGPAAIPWLDYDDRRDVILARVLRWQPGPGSVTLTAETAFLEVLDLLMTYWGAINTGRLEVFEDVLAAFCRDHSPLVAVPEGGSLHLAALRPKMDSFALMARLLGHLAPRRGFPPALGRADGLVRKQIEALAGSTLSPGERALLAGFLESRDVAATDRLLLWLQAPSEFGSRDKGITELIVRTCMPLLNGMLQGGLDVKFGFERKGHLRAVALPKDIYTLAALYVLFCLEPGGMRLCACGCGEIAPPGRTYINPAHQRRTNVKQRVLARYRTRKNRGQISSEEYTAIADHLNRLWHQGVHDESQLHQELAEVRPRPGRSRQPMRRQTP